MENTSTTLPTKLEADNSFLHDESHFHGNAQYVYMPESVEQIQLIFADSKEKNLSITVQGGRTGLSGSAVPIGGLVMCLEKLNKVLHFEECEKALLNGQQALACIKVEAGIRLSELEKEIQKLSLNSELCFPTMPTEHSATIGGVLAMGGNGPRGYFYGDVKQYIESIDVCLSDGSMHTIRAEDPLFDNIIGSEGTLAVILAVNLYLIKSPSHCWGIAFFFPSNEDIASFVQAVNALQKNENEHAYVTSIEYLDSKTVECIATYQPHMDSIVGLPQVPNDTAGIVLTEIASESEEALMELAEILMGYCVEYNADPDQSWAMSTEQEVRTLQNYRHAAAECINMQMAKYSSLCESIALLCSDIVLPEDDILSLLKYYTQEIADSCLEAYIFGHIASNHLYVKIVSKNKEEYDNGLALLSKFLEKAKNEHGLLWKDHGIGKIKNTVIQETLPKEKVSEILNIKKQYDNTSLFNRHNGITED